MSWQVQLEVLRRHYERDGVAELYGADDLIAVIALSTLAALRRSRSGKRG